MTSEDAYRRFLDALERHGSTIQDKGAQAVAQCPAHLDGRPSLRITDQGTGAILIHCFAGCAHTAILDELSLTAADLYDTPRGAEYRYDDGRIVRRTPDKRFFQSGNTAARPQLYRLAAVVDAVAHNATVYLVEGEKDVHALESIGAVATTAPMGASNFGKVDVTPLAEGIVVLVPDQDDAGKRWLADALAAVTPVAHSVRVRIPAVGKDAADHVAAGHGLDDFAVPPGSDEPPEVPEPESLSVERDPVRRMFVTGDVFILDAPDKIPAVWGDGHEVLWADGEALMLNGPAGVGKSTIAGQLVRARLGLQDHVLGWPVEAGMLRVLYLAMDRPPQIARANRRLYTEADREVLRARLVVWRGPPPYDLAKRPETLVEMAFEAGADTIVVDSLKDAAVGLSDDETAAGYNRARQQALADGFQVIELHHQRKAVSGKGATPPNTLDDVYGSTWLTAGAGSVLLFWGAPGDAIVEMRHLKQPMDPVGPLRILHDHDAGTSVVYHSTDMLALAVANRGRLTAKLAAKALCEKDDPTPNEVEKARRRLDRLVEQGLLIVTQQGSRGGADRTETMYGRASVGAESSSESNHESNHAENWWQK